MSARTTAAGHARGPGVAFENRRLDVVLEEQHRTIDVIVEIDARLHEVADQQVVAVAGQASPDACGERGRVVAGHAHRVPRPEPPEDLPVEPRASLRGLPPRHGLEPGAEPPDVGEIPVVLGVLDIRHQRDVESLAELLQEPGRPDLAPGVGGIREALGDEQHPQAVRLGSAAVAGDAVERVSDHQQIPS